MLAVLGLPNIVTAAIVVAAVAVVFRSRVFGTNEPTDTSWFDACLKAIVIVVFTAFTAVYLPSYVLQTKAVADLDGTVRDLLGAGTWLAAFAATLWGLWYAHREKRV
ncbi:MAG: hypothetical protein ACE5GB_02050 [Acidimicrobiales bacterium]